MAKIIDKKTFYKDVCAIFGIQEDTGKLEKDGQVSFGLIDNDKDRVEFAINKVHFTPEETLSKMEEYFKDKLCEEGYGVAFDLGPLNLWQKFAYKRAPEVTRSIEILDKLKAK